MKARDVLVNGIPLDVILRHYNSIFHLIREVKNLNGSFENWDRARAIENNGDMNVKIEIKNIIL